MKSKKSSLHIEGQRFTKDRGSVSGFTGFIPMWAAYPDDSLAHVPLVLDDGTKAQACSSPQHNPDPLIQPSRSATRRTKYDHARAWAAITGMDT